MFDAHVRAWKRHLERLEIRRLVAMRSEIEKGWRVKWVAIEERRKTLKERAWRT